VSKKQPYNPLAAENLGVSVARALLKEPLEPLAKLRPFKGAGIYAVYYCGSIPEYEPLTVTGANGQLLRPIYVGKAVPKGRRKGKIQPDSAGGSSLYKRIEEHVESIEAATSTLSIDEFRFRCLVVDPLFIALGEGLLIAKYAPLWNQVIDGFGNHDPGKGRHKGKRPRWDVVHPGRAWADKCEDRDETAAQILHEVAAHFRSETVPRGVPQIQIDFDDDDDVE
jgi:hypothetical protein